MSREIKVSKYEGNTHYTVVVIDSYGQEHHVGIYKHIYTNKLEEKALEIWSNEVKREITPMERAISWCVNNDISKGREPSLD
jgi:DUF971 family protein